MDFHVAVHFSLFTQYRGKEQMNWAWTTAKILKGRQFHQIPHTEKSPRPPPP